MVRQKFKRPKRPVDDVDDDDDHGLVPPPSRVVRQKSKRPKHSHGAAAKRPVADDDDDDELVPLPSRPAPQERPTAPHNNHLQETPLTLRRGQLEVANAMTDRALAHGMAELKAEPGFGKTLVLATAAAQISYERKRLNAEDRCVAFFFSPSAPMDENKFPEYGAVNSTNFQCKTPRQRKELLNCLNAHGMAGVYMSTRSFSAGFNTQRKEAGSDEKVFTDLEFEDMRKTRRPQLFEDDNAPSVFRLAQEFEVTTLIIAVDEHQGVLGQDSSVFTDIISLYRELGQAPFLPPEKRFKVYVLMASATWEYKKEYVTAQRQLENMSLVYCGVKIGAADVKRLRKDEAFFTTEKARVLARREQILVTATEEQENEARQCSVWQTGVRPFVFPHRQKWLALEQHGESFRFVKRALVMQALIDPDKHCPPNFTQWWGGRGGNPKIRIVEGRGATIPESKNNDKIEIAVTGIHKVVYGYLTAMDTIAFITGRFEGNKGDIPLNALHPARVTMRKVVRLTGNATNPVECVPVEHYHCVLIVIDHGTACNAGLQLIKDSLRQEDGSEHTLVFDATSYEDGDLVSYVQNKIKPKFLENKKQIYILTCHSQVVGANCFGDFATACVTIGNFDDALRKQCFRRLARCTTPYVNMVFPGADATNGGYVFHHFASKATARINNEHGKHANRSTFEKMIELKEDDDTPYTYFEEALERLKKTCGTRDVERYYKYFFFRYGDRPVRSKPLVIGEDVDERSLVREYLRLLPERNKKSSDVWNEEFTQFLVWVTQTRS